MMESLWYYMGYEDDDITPSPNQVKLRHLLMRQIKLSNIRLRSVRQPISPWTAAKVAILAQKLSK